MSGLDLYGSQRDLVFMLLCAAAVGLGLGICFDLLRCLRICLGMEGDPGRRSFFSAAFLFVEDVVFAVIGWISMILLCYYTNDGLLRAPAVLGVASGFFVYIRTIGRLTRKTEERLSRLLRKAVVGIFTLLRRPVLWGLGQLRRPVLWLWRKTLGQVAANLREGKRRREEAKMRALDEVPPPVSHGKTVFSTRKTP